MVHVPTATSVTIAPETVHTLKVADAKLTGRSDDALAVKSKRRFSECLGRESCEVDRLAHREGEPCDKGGAGSGECRLIGRLGWEVWRSGRPHDVGRTGRIQGDGAAKSLALPPKYVE